ncbi:hypothetical protein [Bradyrhizobium sp. NAS96.2]|uniref:hypothetical protein n=1 Tax=Bradyrhizobium sp. NAS96.2 TaxID=1680160 RepID=UPI0011610381|nr:hypothetical protein [Bradyrhizobium sp. NAS96.2]
MLISQRHKRINVAPFCCILPTGNPGDAIGGVPFARSRGQPIEAIVGLMARPDCRVQKLRDATRSNSATPGGKIPALNDVEDEFNRTVDVGLAVLSHIRGRRIRSTRQDRPKFWS